MGCLRCGRETAEQQVFCNACLDNMARHPVKSDTPIYLPVHKANVAPKRRRRYKRERTAEEMVVILKKRVRVLTAIAIILFMMLSAAAAGAWLAIKQGASLAIPNIGQNFKIVTDIFTGTEEEGE